MRSEEHHGFCLSGLWPTVEGMLMALVGTLLLPPQAARADYSGLINVSSRTAVQCSRYSYDRGSQQMRCTASIKNTSSEPIQTPLVLTFSNLPQNVTLVADGSFPDGTAYADFTSVVSGGVLQPGATTGTRQIAFHSSASVRLQPTIAVWAQPPLSVSCSASPTTGPIPLTVAFSATASGSVAKYEWDFDGDGTYDWSSTTTGSTSHTYPSVGSYSAMVRVTDSFGSTATATVTIVAQASLEARPAVTPTSGFAPLLVYFTTNGYDPVGTIQIFRWDFDGNGSWDTYDTVARDYTHTYSASGTYHPVLYVQSSTGATATASLTITVNNSPPRATADVVPSNGEVPLAVQLLGSGTDPDGQIVLYEWDFEGDGTYDWSSTTTGNASHTYDTEGTYQAVFRVTDNQGLTATATAIATVVNVGPKGSPTATASATPTSGAAPLTVNFNGTATDPDNAIVLYEWDFDNDGVYDWSSTTNGATTHTYTQAGTHVAAFRATDQTGLTGVDHITILVDLTTSLSVENNTIGTFELSFINYCRLSGTVATASSYYYYYPPAGGIDGNGESYWLSAYGDYPGYVPPEDPYPGDTFIEVTFPSPQSVSQIHLNGGSWWDYYGITRGRVELFDAAGTLLNSQEAEIGSSYVQITFAEVQNVTRCRLIVLASSTYYDYYCTLGEFEVGRIDGGQFINHCLMGGVTVNASSAYDYYYYPPQNVVDGDPETPWVSAYEDTPNYNYEAQEDPYPGDTFFEVTFPSAQTVAQVNINGGSWWTSYGILRGRIELFDAAGNVLYSKEVDIGSSFVEVPITETPNVTRCRLTALATQPYYYGYCSLAELEVGRVPTGSPEPQGTNINTTISADTSVSLYIKNALGNRVRTLVNSAPRVMGSYSDYWDCRDDSGFLVNDGLYYAILAYQLQGSWHELDLSHSTGGTRHEFPFGSGQDQRDSFQNGFTFSPFDDEQMAMNFRLSKAQEVTAFIGPLWGGSDQDRLRTIVNRQAFPAGQSTIYWDGLTDQGEIAQAPYGDYLITGFWRYDLPDNAIYMTGGMPGVTGVSAEENYFSPFSEKCDTQGRSEGITLTFTLSENAQYVELRVYSVTTSTLLRTIQVNNLEAGEHSIYWDGKNNNDEYVDIGDYRLGVIAKDADGNESMLRYTLVRIDY